jgi:hypothetical protein
MELMSNVPNQRRTFRRQIKQYRLMSKQLFPSWKNSLNPSEDQIAKYLRRLGEPLEVSPTVAEVL